MQIAAMSVHQEWHESALVMRAESLLCALPGHSRLLPAQFAGCRTSSELISSLLAHEFNATTSRQQAPDYPAPKLPHMCSPLPRWVSGCPCGISTGSGLLCGRTHHDALRIALDRHVTYNSRRLAQIHRPNSGDCFPAGGPGKVILRLIAGVVFLPLTVVRLVQGSCRG